MPGTSIVPPLAPWLGATCGTMLQGVEWLVTQVAGWPGAYAYCSSPGPWWAGGLYAAAALCVAAPRLRPGGGWLISGAMLWGAMGLASLAALRPAHDELRCTFLAVGHGTCAVLELPGGQTLLYDAGSLAGPETTTRTIAGFLRSRGIARIDALVISHADVDHYNAMPGLLEQFPIGVVYVSPMMFDPLATDGQLAAPEALRAAAVAQRVPLREIWMNDRLRTPAAEVTIDVLHPPREGVLGRDNANSLVLTVEYAGRRILLPGDLEAAGLESVLAEPPLDCDVLLAPHHGSPLSDPPGFAAWCTPEWVVMSGGREDRTGDAPRAYELAGAQVFHTATAGAVEFRLTAAELRVSTYVPKTT
ncbi:MAG TPA: MBL fold metallo-hydrolase, partial [Lacipirellulaceae bacterium]|nr:MBL fold metallo-hydrolase [Lacipirellulaceae bacterium]